MAKIEKILLQSFEIEVHYKKIKHIYLRIKQDGTLMISAPMGISKDYLIKFVKSRLAWIERKQQKIVERKKLSIVLEEDEMLLFAQPFKGRLSGAKLQQLLHEKIVLYHDKYWPFFKVHGCKPVTIKYRMMKSTWGVCRPTIGTITFNKRLVHQPVEFIEYVVLHELCHLLVPNHSSDFYRLIACQMPDFKQYENRRITCEFKNQTAQG